MNGAKVLLPSVHYIYYTFEGAITMGSYNKFQIRHESVILARWLTYIEWEINQKDQNVSCGVASTVMMTCG